MQIYLSEGKGWDLQSGTATPPVIHIAHCATIYSDEFGDRNVILDPGPGTSFSMDAAEKQIFKLKIHQNIIKNLVYLDY